MVVRTTHMDSTILVINVYAPTDKSEREGIFDFLRRTLVSYEGPVVLGGVFNCTLNPHLDRSCKTTTGRHDSPALRRLLARVQMSDVLRTSCEGLRMSDLSQNFTRLLVLTSTPCQVKGRPALDWIGGTSALRIQIGSEMYTIRSWSRSR